MEILYTTEQVAEHCGITYQWLRDCFAEGVLPEPKHMKRFKTKTMRKFTQAEADKLKDIFADKNANKFAEKRRRTRIRKQIAEPVAKKKGKKK